MLPPDCSSVAKQTSAVPDSDACLGESYSAPRRQGATSGTIAMSPYVRLRRPEGECESSATDSVSALSEMPTPRRGGSLGGGGLSSRPAGGATATE